MLPIDLTTVLKDAPVGEWIALSHGQERIVASDVSLERAIQKAQEVGEESPVLMKVPPVSTLIL